MGVDWIKRVYQVWRWDGLTYAEAQGCVTKLYELSWIEQLEELRNTAPASAGKPQTGETGGARPNRRIKRAG